MKKITASRQLAAVSLRCILQIIFFISVSQVAAPLAAKKGAARYRLPFLQPPCCLSRDIAANGRRIAAVRVLRIL